MILAIVGSMSLDGNQDAMAAIEDVLDRYKPDKVVTGRIDRGVDAMAAKAWERRSGKKAIVFLPKVENWLQGYKPRNILIAEKCTHLVRIVASNAKTYGSGWTRDYAKKLGKPTEEIVIEVGK